MPHKGRIVESEIGPQEQMLQQLFSGLIGFNPEAFQNALSVGNDQPFGVTGFVTDNPFLDSLATLGFVGRPTGNPLRFLNKPAEQFLTQTSRGVVPGPVKQAFENNLARDLARIRESFGSAGARFGTDLGDTLGRTAGEARASLGAQTIDRAQGAAQLLSGIQQASRTLQSQTQLQGLQQLLGLGQRTTGLEFARSEAGLNRVVQEYIARLQASPLHKLVESFLDRGAE